MEYKIINASDIMQMEKTVAMRIADGWMPQGGISVISEKEGMLGIEKRIFFQAMVRHDKR